ncbi:MAG TPA: hypothetical protein VJ249_01300 [Candidatus Bathyarchaeia archaeon]|nr:hypothetical protein [Candidatus Bathyarchaeia archaeon]
MAVLPAPLRDRKFVGKLFQENLGAWLYEPRHWRVDLKDIKKVSIGFLNFSPPRYDFLISATLANGQTLQFYNGLVAEESAHETEMIYGTLKLGRFRFRFVDGYTNSKYVQDLLEAWCRKKKLGSLGFVGQFVDVVGEAHVKITKLEPLNKRGQEATTNYLYRCKGSVEFSSRKLDFDIVAKRFLPRIPFNRGNNEYAILRALPSGIVPNVHGALVNRQLQVNGESQVLVLFSDFLEGAVEIGKQIWDLMNAISRKRSLCKGTESELERLTIIVKEAIDRVVFPFHKGCFEKWHSPGFTIRQDDEYHKWYRLELEQNLKSLRLAKVLTLKRAKTLSKLFKTAWTQILGRIVVTEIHHDLMWRQILKAKDRLVILDLDEHMKGHAAKDLADLCAANRFIAEDLRPVQHEYVRSIAEDLNTLILKSYMKNAEEMNAAWAANLEDALKVYLAYRHLHDAAYYAPVWRQAETAREKINYKRYVDFSLNWLEKSEKLVEELLET